METKEFTKQPRFYNNGFLQLAINILILAGVIITAIRATSTLVDGHAWDLIACCLLALIYTLHVVGFVIVQPNQSRVLTFFGRYAGTLRINGFFWINPFYGKRKLSLRARNMDVAPIKVNDKNGNPIMIGLVLVWKIKDTFKASFDIDVDTLGGSDTNAQGDAQKKTLQGYDSFVSVQSDAALRKVAGLYAYDNIDNHKDAMTLRSGGDEINHQLETELASRLAIAGIEVIEARINYLAYAAEIASVMLRRQQADAIISAREKIVEGAVSMVELALHKLEREQVISLDEEKKAQMVSNLLVVLCADESASPVINTGTLY